MIRTPLLRLLAAAAVPGTALLSTLPVQAQSSVNLSGTIDLGVYRGFDKRTQVGPISRSSLTFSGSEDLGGGLSAIFNLTTRFDPDTGRIEDGNKPFWHGESTVGLKGAFGKIRIGRAMEAVTANDWAFDPWYNFDRVASPAWQFWHWNYAADRTANNGTPEYFRLSNGIFYDSPTVAGFSVSLSGSPEKSAAGSGGANTSTSMQGALKYAQGPVAATVSKGRNGSGDEVLFIGAKGTFGNFALMGAYDRSEYNALPRSVALARTLGATYQWGKVLFQAGYGKLSVDDGTKRSFVGLGSQYALSKRTYVYASYGQNRPENAANTSAYGLGLNHSF
jgi:predicted porin